MTRTTAPRVAVDTYPGVCASLMLSAVAGILPRQANDTVTHLFISDLHLSAARPDKTQLLEHLLAAVAGKVTALYILGDLFEVVVGDDDDTAPLPQIVHALSHCSERGTPIWFMHGNRDFLLGTKFAQASGCSLLGDSHVIDLYGRRTLLMHGDLLCTQDLDYQRFRQRVRQPRWQQRFLGLPLWLRKLLGRYARWRSQLAGRNKSDAIMDVNENAVRQTMRHSGAVLLIHGHTHRPAVHNFKLDEREVQRIILGDWYEQDSVLMINEFAAELLRIEEFLQKC